MTWKTPRIQKNGEGVARARGAWVTARGRSSHKAIAHRIFPEIPFHNS